MGDRDAGVGGGGDPGGDAGDDLELDPGLAQRFPLLAAAAEDERVAALQPHDALAGPGRLDQPLADLLLRHRGLPRAPCRRRPARRPRGRRQRPGRDQPVVEDRVGARRSAPASAPSSAPGRRARRRPGRRPPPARSFRCAFDSYGWESAPKHAPSPRRGRGARGRRRRAGARRARRRPRRLGRRRPRSGRAATRCRRAGRRRLRSASSRRRRRSGRGRRSGSSQVASSRATAARSAVSSRSARFVDRSASTAAQRRLVAGADLQHQRALARQPGVIASAGIAKPISPSRPSRRSPAAASTIASSSPSASLRRRVSTLPCSSSPAGRGAPRAAGRGGAGWRSRPGRPRGRRRARSRRRSRRRPRSSRGGTAAIISPSGSSAGRSLAE